MIGQITVLEEKVHLCDVWIVRVGNFSIADAGSLDFVSWGSLVESSIREHRLYWIRG